jgi:hypothetical protein
MIETTGQPTSKREIKGEVIDSLAEGETKLNISSSGKRRFFINNHNFTIQLPLLVLIRDECIEIEIKSPSQRGLAASLDLITRANNESASLPVAKAVKLYTQARSSGETLILDRWSDGSNAALAAGSIDLLKSQITDFLPGGTAEYHLKVEPINSAVAAGIEWSLDGPWWHADRVAEFQEMLDYFPERSQIHRGGNADYFEKVSSNLRRIVDQLEDTVQEANKLGAALTATHIGSGGTKSNPVSINSPGQVGALVRGRSLVPRRQLRVKVINSGQARAFAFRVLVCADESERQALSEIKPRAAAQ